MSDPVENLEFIFKKHDANKPKSLYSDNKQQNQNNLKPQDVISSVFKQLKAIQCADSVTNKSSVNKDFLKFKKSNFLSVNNLPVYEEVPKSAKFDTQCVSDTQLINLIEDAEIVDTHRGMTQEFETTFCHNTEKENFIDYKSEEVDGKGSKERGKEMEKMVTIEENRDVINDNIAEDRTIVNGENNEDIDMELGVISPIMCSNNVLDTVSKTDTQDSNIEYTQVEDFSQILDDAIETDIDKSIERPLSPIIFHKNIKIKSKTPSPLVFALDKFEQFEKIAVPILESDNDLTTVKRVINSQILNKELHIPIGEDIQINEGDFSAIESKDFKEINILKDKTVELKIHPIKSLDSDTYLEFIELDKATSDDLIKKVMNEDFEKLSTKAESEILKDEILFSSDEEENYVHKSYQDLPFTCALETSFYNQSDVLDKTMYVGFQTASNKSIQVFTESFSHAKSILSGEITITDMVNNCDREKNKELGDLDGQAKMDFDAEEKEFNFRQTELPELKTSNSIKSIEDKLPSNKKFEGFKTASKKEIKLSQKALARCKKVFQDIDLNEDFESKIDEEYLEEEIARESEKIKEVTNSPSREISKNIPEEDIQNIDDVIIQEFENIEMSLKEDKEPDKYKANSGFKTASNKDIKISDTALSKIKDIFKDIDFEEDLNEHDNIVVNAENNSFETKDEQDLTNTNLVGFKTASNKKINISEEALTKTKSIFDNIDSVQLPNKSNQKLEKEKQDTKDYEQPSTSKAVFVGFKTANNKNINISEQALAKTKNIFKDLDAVKLPQKNKKDIKDNTSENNTINEHSNNKTGVDVIKGTNNDNPIDVIDDNDNIFEGIHSQEFQVPMEMDTYSPKKDKIDNNECDSELNGPSTSKCSFVGFKTANNKNIQISAAALSKTKNIFKDIDSEDFKFPDKGKNKDGNIYEADKEDKTPANGLNFGGFKTANNKAIKISNSDLAKTRNIFQDIDSDDFKFPSKVKNNISERTIENDRRNIDENTDFNKPSTSTESFVGFKTANNRKISISKEALAKTKNIFNDIDTVKFPEKLDKLSSIIKPIENDNIVNEKLKTIEDEDFNKPSTSIAGIKGFMTASNKKVAISEESLAKTRNIFQDIDAVDVNIPEGHTKNEFTDKEDVNIELNEPSTSKLGFVGFKTANNRNIKISKQALEKTKNIFKDIDANDFGFSKDTGREIINEGKSVYPEPEDTPSITSKGFVGFKTANNKVINISETALLKTKNIFKDLGSVEIQNSKKAKTDYPDIVIDDDNIKFNQDKGDDNTKFNIPEHNIPTFQGFQTASNKQVKISAEALIKSRKIFQDINTSEEFDSKENNTIIDSNKETFDANKEKTNKHEDNIDTNTKSSPIFKGFQTANKKAVKVSKEALAKSRKLFENLNTDDDIEPPFHGFPTTNNKKVESLKDLIKPTTSLEGNKKTKNNFKGFQTASDKKVCISAEALVESRKLFEDFDNNDLINKESNTNNIKFGFKTATNRDIKVSDEALARTKRLFSDIDDVKDSLKNEVNISDIINTQVLNNFDESLHTEDFFENEVKSKRSGSPILSCPRAKRRKKFEIPYSQKIKEPEIIKIPSETKDVNKIIFTKDYKKHKTLKLKDLAKLSNQNEDKIDPYLLKFTFENLLEFKFDKNRNDISNEVMTIEKLKELFQNAVNDKLIPKGWLDNHLKLILWKLISYEFKFKMSNVCNARNVIDQLKYRYDKELYNAQRSALRKIFEKDDVPSKTLVLFVAGIFENGVSVASPTTDNLDLLLSDGWYCIMTTIDKMLAQLVCQGKIVVGTKLVTNGAELVNCEPGISPWEDTSAVRLKIFGNSTRRAHWDARLGYHGNGAMLSQLSSVRVDGGKVARLRVFVTRVYPGLYVEKFEDGSTVTRSERLEHLHQMKSEAERQAAMEKIYEEVEKEFADEDSQDSEGFSELSSKRPCLDSGSQIAKLMKTSKDPSEFRAGLTASQSRLLEAHNSKKREDLLQNIQQKIRDRIEKTGVGGSRNVVTLLKIRVAGVREKSGVEVVKGMMSIWKPADAVLDIIKEGAWIDVLNVVPTAVRYSEIQISAGRQSVFSKSKYKESEIFKPYTNLLKRNCFTIKDLAKNTTMTTDYNEIDTVGFIFLIDPSVRDFDSNKQPFQNIFLADADKNIICINFWGGLKKFGYQNVLDTGQIVACFNLQKRAGNTRKSIPQYRVTEFTYFTKTPKNENARNLLDNLSKKFLSLDRRKFIEDCVILKNNFAVLKANNENISPYRINNSDFNISKNKMFIDSPLARPSNIDSNFNLTGLDFESTFKQTDSQNLSEEVLLRKRKVNEKIARLKMYGEPPPLSTIHIINKSKNASNSYKSPLNRNTNISKITTENPKNKTQLSNSKSDSSINVASVIKTPEKGVNLNESVPRSPLLNRTYVKSVNPVKINFDVRDNNDSNVDHFAEEFDGSPPLSLD
ncbi:breast cancer type 2 susceptibility protein [Helicoverpa zea]|uniref:breast cancer type 2 susceptibility protein n=1 Tax=Helicoverpa zea TaxID=7113 RepID=UPI001F5827EB|nr:breast cancer type 2 susceptibility protein [Helicoverpa zea]